MMAPTHSQTQATGLIMASSSSLREQQHVQQYQPQSQGLQEPVNNFCIKQYTKKLRRLVILEVINCLCIGLRRL